MGTVSPDTPSAASGGRGTPGIVGVEAAALAALDKALGGVEALSTAISLMTDAANKIVQAKDASIEEINSYFENDLKGAIDAYAKQAVNNALPQADPMIDPRRRAIEE